MAPSFHKRMELSELTKTLLHLETVCKRHTITLSGSYEWCINWLSRDVQNMQNLPRLEIKDRSHYQTHLAKRVNCRDTDWYSEIPVFSGCKPSFEVHSYLTLTEQKEVRLVSANKEGAYPMHLKILWVVLIKKGDSQGCSLKRFCGQWLWHSNIDFQWCHSNSWCSANTRGK